MDLLARPWMLLVALPVGAALFWAEVTLRRGRAGGGSAARGVRIALRSALVVLLALAAAGLRLGRGDVRPACVFALDVSRSMGGRSRVEDAYFRARGLLPPGTPRAVCAFAGLSRAVLGFPEVETVDAGLGLDEVASRLGQSRTNVAGGLRSALGLIPPATAGAVVLVSDGRETEGRTLEAALECRARGVPVLALIPAAGERGDLRVESFSAPSVVEAGRPVPLAVALSSSHATRAEVVTRRLPGGGEVGRVAVALRSEAPAFVRFSDGPRDRPQTSGVARYEVEVRPLGAAITDGWPENDRAEAAVRVRGTPKVLILTKGGAVAGLLHGANQEQSTRFAVRTARPGELPASADELAGYSADELAGYSAVVIEGLGRKDVREAQEAAIVRYLRLGGGLFVTGGPGAFGAGGWRDSDGLPKALPVRMTPGPLKRMLVVLIVDASGSMRMEAAGGRTKMELAREAVAAVMPELERDDQVALVAFRDRAELLLGPVSAAMRDEVLDRVRDLKADGPTSLVAPLEKGLDVLHSSAAERRVAILLSDGEPTVEFSYERLLELARGFRGEDTSLHVLGTNPSAQHRELLAGIARAAGGIVEHQSDYSKVKEALWKLFERATSRYVREGPVEVLPAGVLPDFLEGLGEFPALDAVNRTQLAPGGRSVLVAATGEPVLALGEAGAGRAAAFASTLGEPWAGGFGSWDKRVRFISQLLREITPPPAEEGVTVRAVREAEGVFLEVEAVTPEGEPRNLLDLTAEYHTGDLAAEGERRLREPARQVALGRYRARVPPGLAESRRTVSLAVFERGARGERRRAFAGPVTFPPPPEILLTGLDRAALDEIARASGGRVLASPEEIAPALGELRPKERRDGAWLLALAALGVVIAELVVRLLSSRLLSSRLLSGRLLSGSRSQGARPEARTGGSSHAPPRGKGAGRDG